MAPELTWTSKNSAGMCMHVWGPKKRGDAKLTKQFSARTKTRGVFFRVIIVKRNVDKVSERLRHFMYFFPLSVLGAGSWLCQLLDVFLLSMRYIITRQTCLKLISCLHYSNTSFRHCFSLEFECWDSEKVTYSKTYFMKWCSIVLFVWILMPKFKEGLESSPTFWTAALQTKCQKLAEPNIPREATDRKIKEKKEER